MFEKSFDLGRAVLNYYPQLNARSLVCPSDVSTKKTNRFSCTYVWTCLPTGGVLYRVDGATVASLDENPSAIYSCFDNTSKLRDPKRRVERARKKKRGWIRDITAEGVIFLEASDCCCRVEVIRARTLLHESQDSVSLRMKLVFLISISHFRTKKLRGVSRARSLRRKKWCCSATWVPKGKK